MASVVNQSDKKALNFIWDGLYTTWETACDRAKSTKNMGGGGLNSSRWLKRITKQLSDYKNEFRKYGMAIPPRPCNLPLICAITNPRTIIDFGGSSGWSWEYLKNSLPKNRIDSYCIIETKKVVDYMEMLGVHKAPVIYKTHDDEKGCCDLLYSNSVLQYLKSNDLLLYITKKKKPKYIFLEDCIAHRQRDFFTTQKYYKSKIPYRFIGLRKILNDFVNYAEIVSFPYVAPILGMSTPLEMGNFPKAYRTRYAISVLMKRLDRE